MKEKSESPRQGRVYFFGLLAAFAVFFAPVAFLGLGFVALVAGFLGLGLVAFAAGFLGLAVVFGLAVVAFFATGFLTLVAVLAAGFLAPTEPICVNTKASNSVIRELFNLLKKKKKMMEKS